MMREGWQKVGTVVTLTLLTFALLFFSVPGIQWTSVEASSPVYSQDIPEEPDIKISELSFSETDVREGDEVIISVTVKNNETYDMDIDITLIWGDQEFERLENETIDAGSETTFDFEWEAQAGRHPFTAVLTIDLPEPIGMVELDHRSETIEVNPEPVGDIFYPLAILALIFLVVIGTVLVPSVLARIKNR